MYFDNDNAYNDILEKSVQQWLDEMEENDNVAVHGGVRAVREYVNVLKKQIAEQKEKNVLKDEYLKKLRKKIS